MRFYEFKNIPIKNSLLEAAARIDHAEDLIFTEGSRGAIRAIESLSNLEDGQHESVTIKWDGSPAVIFGRNEDGEFIFTDKSGFGAVGYDGKAKSAKDLGKMLSARPGASNPDPVKKANYETFIQNMTDVYDEYEQAIPKEFRGYYKGDLLYFNTPPEVEGKITFTPNIVTYKVSPNSEIGKRIAASKTGVVVHRFIDESGMERPVSSQEANDLAIGEEVLVFPPVTPQKPPSVNDNTVRDLKAEVNKNASAIDAMLNSQTLTNIKMKDLPKVFYNYLNQKVDSGMTDLGKDFLQWVTTAKLSDPKKKRIAEYIGSNQQGFNAMWSIITGIINLKNDVIGQFDSHDADITASIGKQAGGEGYVIAHPGGDIKLVNRSGFTAANRAVER